jgi:hypothetical protein
MGRPGLNSFLFSEEEFSWKNFLKEANLSCMTSYSFLIVQVVVIQDYTKIFEQSGLFESDLEELTNSKLEQLGITDVRFIPNNSNSVD